MTLSLRRLWWAALLVGTPAGAAPPERGPMPHGVDLHRDPLPHGAIARLGSVRLRHSGLGDCAVSGDGKTAVTVGDDQTIRWWDLTTGRQTRSAGLPAAVSRFALSGDGGAMAVFAQESITLHDPRTGRALRTVLEGQKWVDSLAFSPDASRLAVGVHSSILRLVSLTTGAVREVSVAARPGPGPRAFLQVAFAADGRWVVVTARAGGNPRPVLVIDAADGSEVFAVPGGGLEAAFSPDRSRLAVCTLGGKANRDDFVIRMFDLKTHKEVSTFQVEIDRNCFALAFTPDGQGLACAGASRGWLIDTATGRPRYRLPGGLDGLGFSADGRTLFARDFCRLRLWDAATGRERHDRPGEFGIGATAVSADGRVLAAEDIASGDVGLWDLTDGRRLQTLPSPDEDTYNLRLAFAPTCRTLLATRSRGVAWAWDVRTGRATRPTPVWCRDEPWGPYHEYVPAPDGRRLAALTIPTDEADRPRRLEVWAAATGRVLHRHALGLPGAVQVFQWVSPDGPIVIRVVGERKVEVRLVDVDTGRVGPRVEADESFTVSADGRLAAGWTDGPVAGEGGSAVVWDLVTGREVLRVPTGEGVHRALALAAGARALVVADGRALRVIDLVTGKERGRGDLPGFGLGYSADHPVWEVRVLPGDRAVYTPLHDRTAIVWDLSAFPAPRLADAHGAEHLRRWWDELAGENDARALAAEWELAEAPDVVRFLRERVRPVPPIDPGEVRKRLAELDSPKFAVREAAAGVLEKMGPAVWPYLRGSAGRSAEAAERLGKVEERLSAPIPPAETLRVLRAVAVLERVGTADARKMLEELAGGASGAPETQAARGALGRLRRAAPGW